MARRLSVFVLILATVVGAEDYSRAKKYYDSHIGRPSLQMRTRGRVALAKTDDRRAVEILSASYSRPNAPKDQERYLIISIAAEYCIDKGHVPLYDAWRKRHTRFEDAWLWYKALVMNVDALGADAAQAVALGKDNVFVRAAAVRALGASIEPYVLPIIPKLLSALPQKSIERAVIIESCAAALLAQQEHLGTEE
ncbi:MAG: hypothetical protein O7E54_03310, partial [Planctomycetota bacterium]|nr:hypothetical protein [Planctomycetota bacterium]